MQNLFKISLLIFTVASASALARPAIYVVAGAGVADVDTANTQADGGTYKVALGMQVLPQWYVELSYQDAFVEDIRTFSQGSVINPTQYEDGLKADAIALSFLGKATGQVGELYYRIGLLQASYETTYIASEGSCANGSATPLADTQGNVIALCHQDDDVLGGVLGLGFDFVIAENLYLRTEIEHISGEDDFTMNSAYVGLRYNF